MGSTRAELPEDLLGVNQATSCDVGTGLAECLMKRNTLALIEPVARVERQELQLGPVRQVCRLIDHEASRTDSRCNGHANERSIGTAAQQANGAVAAKLLCNRGVGPRGSFADVRQRQRQMTRPKLAEAFYRAVYITGALTVRSGATSASASTSAHLNEEAG